MSQNQNSKKIRIIKRPSPGGFNSQNWLEEGELLLTSAKLNRNLFKRRRRKLSIKLSIHRHFNKRSKAEFLNELKGTCRSSWLLIGYAIEMFLKAGLAKAYVGCREDMFARDVKKFSHDLVVLSQEIDFPITPEDEVKLKGLKEILLKGRYPVFANCTSDYVRQTNERTNKQWNEDEFKRIVSLANRIRQHVKLIDNDIKNPRYLRHLRINEDGYISLRTGGHLPARISYRFSSCQKDNGLSSLQDMIDTLEANAPDDIINQYWQQCRILEDAKTETILKQEFKPA